MRLSLLAMAAVVSLTGCSVQRVLDAQRGKLEALSQRSESEGLVWFTAGEGPPVVLVHGFGDQAATWTKVARSLIEDHRVILLDLPGHGDSAVPHPMDLEHVYEGMVSAIDAAAPEQEFVLIGNSMGGWLSIRYAIEHPARVKQLIAVDAAGLNHTIPRELLLPTNRDQMRDKLEALGGGFDQPYPGSVLQQLVDMQRPAYGALFDSFTVEDFIDDDLRKLSVPTSLIWGSDDGMFDMAYARRLQAAIPGAPLTVLPGCSHSPQYDCALDFTEAVEAAMAKPPKAPVPSFEPDRR